MLPFLHQCIEKEYHGSLDDAVLCDLFAGTGTVAKSFKSKVKKVIANDLEYYSYVLLKHYVGNNKVLSANHYFEVLNRVDGEVGFISREYGERGEAGRNYFSTSNANKIDVMRNQLESWKSSLDDQVYYFLLASLLESVDKIANTASVYGAFLKHIKKTAQKALVVSPAETIEAHCETEVYQEDANVLIRRIKGDILYLDPPYNARQYGANYHLLNTIARYKEFKPKGVTGLPVYNKSSYSSRNKVEGAFIDLLESADFKYVFLSYNNEGLVPIKILQKLMENFGRVNVYTTPYYRFKADNDVNRKHKAKATEEYVLCLQKF